MNEVVHKGVRIRVDQIETDPFGTHEIAYTIRGPRETRRGRVLISARMDERMRTG